MTSAEGVSQALWALTRLLDVAVTEKSWGACDARRPASHHPVPSWALGSGKAESSHRLWRGDEGPKSQIRAVRLGMSESKYFKRSIFKLRFGDF